MEQTTPLSEIEFTNYLCFTSFIKAYIGVLGGSATLTTECGCIGGNTGFEDCEAKDPCGTFKKWVNAHKGNDPGTYYNRKTKVKIASNNVCTQNTSPPCDIAPDFWWYLDNGDKYFWAENEWKNYYECGLSCEPIALTVTTPLTNNVGNLPPSTGEQGWCVFASLSKISGSTACTHATSYYAQYSTIGRCPHLPNPTLHIPLFYTLSLKSLNHFHNQLQHFLISSYFIDKCSLTKKLSFK